MTREDFGLFLLRLCGLGLALAHGLPKLTALITGQSQMAAAVAKLGFPLPGFFAWAAAGGLLLSSGMPLSIYALIFGISASSGFRPSARFHRKVASSFRPTRQ